MNLIDIAKCLRGAEQVSFTLARTENGIRVLVVPKLAPAASGLTGVEESLRAALASPLIFSVAEDSLDDGLAEALESYIGVRSTACAELEAASERLNAAAEAAAKEAASKRKGVRSKAKEVPAKSGQTVTDATKAGAAGGAATAPEGASTISLFADEQVAP